MMPIRFTYSDFTPSKCSLLKYWQDKNTNKNTELDKPICFISWEEAQRIYNKKYSIAGNQMLDESFKHEYIRMKLRKLRTEKLVKKQPRYKEVLEYQKKTDALSKAFVESNANHVARLMKNRIVRIEEKYFTKLHKGYFDPENEHDIKKKYVQNNSNLDLQDAEKFLEERMIAMLNEEKIEERKLKKRKMKPENKRMMHELNAKSLEDAKLQELISFFQQYISDLKKMTENTIEAQTKKHTFLLLCTTQSLWDAIHECERTNKKVEWEKVGDSGAFKFNDEFKDIWMDIVTKCELNCGVCIY